MQVSITYERAQGWEPKDVSAENLGFDMRSAGSDGTRLCVEESVCRVAARRGA